ncbi:actin-binding LIM protein 1-like isoform X3 [Mytilus californianus]|uniref:actin-binding LIM protein 1-like isoform X3 n=1 Tax=Mytilus californianus TaxID=6549 RepID=UPI00224698E4|nr:actin-binding LIM protein 1-like isoform X3 [Mytilus californianus]
MGQKATKHKDADGEPSPSPRKSPKRSKHRGRSSSKEHTPSHSEKSSSGDPGGGRPYSEIEKPISPVSKKSLQTIPKHESPRISMDYDQKENIPEQTLSRTPPKMNGNEKMVVCTPDKLIDSSISNHFPQATSTPAPNGIISSGQSNGHAFDSDQDQTDQSDDEAFTPSEQQDSLDERGSALSFGKFYNSSYLQKATYLKKATTTPTTNGQKSPHFHRPANFSYNKGTPQYLKSTNKSGMAALASGGKVIVKRTRRASSPADLKNNEAIRLSMYPSAKKPAANELEKIEREDWPAPPALASILPELMRQRRKSRGEKDEDSDDEAPPEDPKIQREIEELSKFKDSSGIGKIIYKELEERKAQPMKLLDPWKASRVPGADHEPKYCTRYQSPMFASPSRFVDRPKRSWDDSDIRGYRTITTLSNYPVAKPGYGMEPRAHTLPLQGMYGGHIDFRYFDFETHRSSRYTSSSTMNTERESFGYSFSDKPGVSLLTLQKSSWHTEAEPQIYPYETLKITNFDLPRDVDLNRLEIHLDEEDFQNILEVPRNEFYRLPLWKQNDMKKKVDLF